MNEIQYPRRRLIRGALRLLGRIALPLLTRLELNHLDRFPKQGPVIVVGNHTGTMEVALMTVYARRQIEYLGSTDIPHPPLVRFFNNLYDLIPIHRGKASRASLEMGLSVLDQGGVLGLFPQGGIWEPSIQRIQTGVAWLSYRSGAPVLPVGFNSTKGALGQVFSLKRPRLIMNVGEPLPPVEITGDRPRKAQLETAAQEIMQAIWDLVPPEDQPGQKVPVDEQFRFEVTVRNKAGEVMEDPEFQVDAGPALSKFIHRPTLFNNLLINLDLPIEPLRQLNDQPSVDELRRATKAILHYLQFDNPYYFTYRYGQQEGAAMEAGIRQLHDLLEEVQSRGFQFSAAAIRSYQDPNTGERIVIEQPEEE